MKSRIARWLLLLAVQGALLFGAAAAPPPPARPTPEPPPDGSGSPVLPPPDFVPDQILVRFRPPERPETVDSTLANLGVKREREVPAIGVHVLRLPPGLPVERAVEIFSGLPQVEFAEPNYLVRTAEIDDPGLAANQWAPQAIHAPEAWASVEGAPTVVIGIVDTGIDYRHTELSSNLWGHGEVAGNGLDDDGNGYVDDVVGWDFANSDGDPLDDNSHGTHVAGIAAAAANDNPAGIVGVCPRCRIMAVKALAANGSGSLDAAASGIVYAVDNGARVINMSFGAPIGTSTLAAAIDYAWNHGALPVAAAGNDGAATKLYPAAYPNAMAVAAVNAGGYHSCFSNSGLGYVSVAAPGEAIYSTTPQDASGQDTYATYSGTSMATPHVAGLAGLLFSQDPARSNADVRRLIETTAVDLGPVGADAYFGAGRIDAYRAILGDTSATTPPAGLFTDSLTASAYPNARKLARDAAGTLHLAWHSGEGGQYRVLYAASTDGGATWSPPSVLFASPAETFHPSLAVDHDFVYVVFPSKQGSSYQIFFARRALSGGDWSTPAPIIAGPYNAVRPTLFVDGGTGRLHLAASSFDDAPNSYYTTSGDQGATWSAVAQVNLATVSGQDTRFVAVHASGQHVYLVARTVEPGLFGLIMRYRLVSVRSLDGGATWTDLTDLSVVDGSEYGFALAGAEDRLYLGYEHAGSIYFRRSDGGLGWSAPESVGTGHWPSLAQEAGGQAWLLWENGGSLSLRHYSGSGWDAADTVYSGTALTRRYYPNLSLGASADFAEWTAVDCSGAPFRLTYGSRTLAQVPPIPQLRFDSAAYAAGEADGGVPITVVLDSPSATPVSVSYATSNGTAIAGSDYTAASGSLAFSPGQTSQTITVLLRDDTADEAEESFTLTLSNAAGAGLGTPATAVVTISDNDPPPVVQFSTATAYVQENAGSASLTVRLSPASGQTVTVDYATFDGSAVAGSDYVATTGSVTFRPGESYRTISVPLVDDALAEPNEAFGVALGNPVNAVLGTPGSITVNVWANDSVSLASSALYVQENAGSARVTVRLNAPSSTAVSVSYATRDGTALAGVDYSSTSGSVTFAPGQTSAIVSVPILDDVLGEANETFTLALSDPTNAQLGSPASATVTISANDTVSLASSLAYVQENAGSATVAVRLNAPSSTPVSVDYATSAGTAAANGDYTSVAGTLTFNPGETSKSISVPILDDAAGEPNETFTLSLSHAMNATLGTPATASITIQANDSLVLSSSSYYVQENAGQATVTVRLSGPSSQAVTVAYTTADGTALAGSDYTATSGTLTFAPGQTSQSVAIPLVDDVLAEANESFSFRLSSPTNAMLGTPSTATITLWANDALSFASSYVTVNEAAGSATLTVRLNAPSGARVTVSYASTGGTATAGSDYTPVSGSLVFDPGQTSKTFSVPILDDAVTEPNETITLALSNPTNAGLGTPATATVTIVNND